MSNVGGWLLMIRFNTLTSLIMPFDIWYPRIIKRKGEKNE